MTKTLKLRSRTNKPTATKTLRRPRKRKHVMLSVDEALTRATVRVRAPSNPLQPLHALGSQPGTIENAIKQLLGGYARSVEEAAKSEGKVRIHPHVMIVHEARCCFGVLVWPRASGPTDLEEMQDAIDERDSACRCKFLVLPLGASA